MTAVWITEALDSQRFARAAVPEPLEDNAWPHLLPSSPRFYGVRQQFLIDHPWYVEMGESLPVHKPPPAAGGDYPLRLSGGHTRWSVHGIWRDQRHMLRLQRGEPVMYMSIDDARRRGLQDHDLARVFNDVGTFVIHVKPSPSLPPGEVIIYHAWENHQFKDWMQSQVAVPSPWKPLHVAGGYGHIRYRMFFAAPSHGPRGTTVEVVKV